MFKAIYLYGQIWVGVGGGGVIVEPRALTHTIKLPNRNGGVLY